MRLEGESPRPGRKEPAPPQQVHGDRRTKRRRQRGQDERKEVEEQGSDEPTPLQLVQELHEAVYGDHWARPDSPKDVWSELLGKVRTMRRLAEVEIQPGEEDCLCDTRYWPTCPLHP